MGTRERLRLLGAHGVTLGDFLERFAALRSDRVLAEEPDGTRWTYGAASDLVARAAGALRERVEPGDRVVITVPNGYRLLLMCLAACRAGAVAIPVNARMTPDEIAYVVDDADARVRIDDFDALAAKGTPAPPIPVDPRSVAMLLYTSGTTGRPKGAQLTHRALVGASRLGAAVPEPLLSRGCVTALPVAHVAGLTMLLLLAAIGAPVYLMPHFRPTDALEAIEHRRAQFFVGVPAMYRMMLEAGAHTYDLSSVRLWASGADTLPADVVDEFQHLGAAFRVPTRTRSIGRATFIDGYGMVELGGGVAFRVFPPLRLPGTGLMRCLPRHPLRIVDPEGNDVPRGQIGEIAVAARGHVLGYHHRPEATAELFTRDGLVRTGDLARAYRLGFFELLGRKKDVIKHGGYSVFSVEVERVLAAHPAVAEAAVIGWPHDTKGEVPVAAVRTNPSTPLTPEALCQFAAERLSDYKVPQRVFLVDELPHTGTGKVNKPLLKRQLHTRDAEPVT